MKAWLTRRKLKSLAKKITQMERNRQNNPVSDILNKKEILMLYEMAKLYDKYQFHKKFPHAKEYALGCYKVAAALNDREAQYIAGERLMEEGKFWDNLKNTFYASKTHARYAEETYKEAFVYLDAAETAGHPLAKRLKGLAYINGWGVEKNNDHGFSLVVESIDQENAWDRATKIFEAIGLNRPEFFSSIMSIRQSKGAKY